MVQICACCGHESDAPTCPHCGQASWLSSKVEPKAKPEVDEEPKSEPKPKKRSRSK